VADHLKRTVYIILDKVNENLTAQHSNFTRCCSFRLGARGNFIPASSTVHLQKQKWKNY